MPKVDDRICVAVEEEIDQGEIIKSLEDNDWSTRGVAFNDEKVRDAEVTAVVERLQACSKHSASSCENELMSREAQLRHIGCNDSIETAKILVRRLA
jgi:hypothetical protein